MNRDDIIRMAREAGGRFHGPHIEHLSISEDDFLTKLAPALLGAGAAAEREACAKVAENGNFLHDDSPEARFGKSCAAAIRARGQS